MKRIEEYGKQQHLWPRWLCPIHIQQQDDGKPSVTLAGPPAAEFLQGRFRRFLFFHSVSYLLLE